MNDTRSRILVIDDERGAREALRMALEPDYEVLTAEGAAEGLAALAWFPAPVVILDLALGGARGEELLVQLRSEHPETEVVIVTGRPGVASAALAVRQGACDYLEKPFDVVELRAAVQGALARRVERTAPPLELEFERRDPGRERAAFLEVLSGAIEAQHPFLGGHARRTALYAELLAEWLGLSLEDQEHVRIAGLLHDVGKIGVPGELLIRAEGLRGPDRERMELHPEIGVRLIAPLRLASAVTGAVRHHHERWDGGGYPAGLAGESIPVAARIVGLADAWDAMSCDRPYRPALGAEEARREVVRCAGSQFDPLLAKEFLALLESAEVEPELLARVVSSEPSSVMGGVFDG